ncbi:MAG: hypothetical protein L0Y54_18575 [Sporichthyaceae bacterium]|nr:hypothetical protein [Sporichthyaceae bacterium]
MSACIGCRTVFMYDPDRVPSIPIDPATGLPPDLNPDGTTRQPDPQAVARMTREPVCPRCCRAANIVRRLNSLPLFPEHDTLDELTDDQRPLPG